MGQEKRLICVVGPTAIGKTRMAVALARIFDTEVISADSRQFYREMSIGTAVPTRQEMSGIPHHFIGHISIHEPYSVGDFEADALDKLYQLFEKKNYVVLVGGSGLFVDAVVEGLDRFPKVDSQIREVLNERLDREGLKVLAKELKTVDPETYARIDRSNPQRVIRALEVYRSSGKPISYFRGRSRSKRPFSTTLIGLNAEREVVYRRIEKRVDEMISKGLELEARALYPYRELNALQTVGYREFFSYFDGELSREQAISEIKKNSRRFAKRQGTWFRKNDRISWFDFETKPEMIASHIKKGGQSPPINT